MSCEEKLVINGKTYVQEKATPGIRNVVVLDRGWVFAGDLHEKNGRIFLTRVKWVFSWAGVGLDGVVDNPKSVNVKLRDFKDMNFPADVELYRIPVSDNWGI